jgi:hypothetical protein
MDFLVLARLPMPHQFLIRALEYFLIFSRFFTIFYSFDPTDPGQRSVKMARQMTFLTLTQLTRVNWNTA